MAVKKYNLVEFLDTEENNIKNIDVVPTEWITYDNETYDLMTKFQIIQNKM